MERTKSKIPPSDSSEEETGSSDEETEDEEQTGGGSSSESGSDECTDTTKLSSQPSAVKAAAPAATPGRPGKRIRESNGEEDEEDEPPPKKKRPAVTNRVQKVTPKPTAELLEKKSATNTKRSKPIKEKSSAAEKKSATKRKIVNPAPKTNVSSRSEDQAPQKPKNLSRPWSPEEELALSTELRRDRISDAFGSSLPSSRTDPYWYKLVSRLSFMEKYEEDHRTERLCEKVKRMRMRYESLNKRLRAGETSVCKNPHEEALWQVWDVIWSPDKVSHETVSDEEEDGSEEGPPEDSEEDIVPSEEDIVPRRQAVLGTSPAKKKVMCQKVVVLDETDDEDEKDDAPVKGSPPAVQAAHAVPAIVASAATSGEGKQGRASKSVSTNGPAVPANDVESGRNTSSVVVHNGTHGGHALISEVMEKSVRADCIPAASDEIRAENLIFLRDMRRICVGMVEEAKVHTEKILEETRVRTSQVLEGLPLVVERLGFHASQSRCWRDMSNPFQGVGLLGEPPLGDLNHGKWLKQRDAEEGLILQRLQLVQEEARIQHDGILLKLSIKKQQVSEHGKQA